MDNSDSDSAPILVRLANPDDVCVRLGIDTPDQDSPEYRQLTACVADASAEMAAIIGRDDLSPNPELTRWTAVLAAGYFRGASATGSLGLVTGISQHTTTIDGYTEGWANYSGAKVPGLSLPPDIAARLRATYGNYSPVVEHRPGQFG